MFKILILINRGKYGFKLAFAFYFKRTHWRNYFEICLISDCVTCLKITSDIQLLISRGKCINIGDLKTGTCLHTFLEDQQINTFVRKHNRSYNSIGVVRDLAITSDNGQIISATSDNTIKIWDIVNKQCLHTFQTGNVIHSRPHIATF